MSVVVKLNGAGRLANQARTITSSNPSPDAENLVGGPATVVPRTGELRGIAPEFTCTLEPCSLTTLRIPQK